MSKSCSICGDDEPFHIHGPSGLIEDFFTVGRGMTDFEAAVAWRRRALEAETELDHERDRTAV